MINARLAVSTAAPGQVASLIAKRYGAFVRIDALSLTAEAWLRARAGVDGASWQQGEFIVSRERFFYLAEAAVESGLLFERQSFPNFY